MIWRRKSSSQAENRHAFCGAKVHNVFLNCSDTRQALTEVAELVEKRSRKFVCFFEANLFSRSLLDGEVSRAINAAALTYPDGIAPMLAARLCTGRKFYRVSGPQFFLAACQYGVSRHWRHFLLGGGEGVAQQLAERLKTQFPGIEIAGVCCPPFRPLTPEEDAALSRQIEECHTDLLWVGLGGPKQEFYMASHQGKLDVPLMLGVGAAFDFHSQNRPWAPFLVRRWGLEWLWRTISGGRRTCWRNVKCVSHIALVLAKDVCRFRLLRRRRSGLVLRKPDGL